MPLDAAPGAAPPTRRRLESWKQIATHLGREVRTAQRWEKSEGLPVHRHHHGQRDTVFAFTDELDAWLLGRTTSAVPGDAPVDGPRETREREPELPVARGSEPRPTAGRRAALVALSLAAVVFVGLAAFHGGRDAAPIASTRLLVLPFDPLSGDDVEVTSGRALHEELISSLAGMDPDRLQVLGRTSALRYAESPRTLPELAEALGVAHLIEGTVERQDELLTVTTRLVATTDEREIWSDSFSLDSDQRARQEARVSEGVRRAVARELLGLREPPPRLLAPPSAADDLSRRGRYLWHKGTEAGWVASIEQFEAALELDPEHLDAHVGLASALCRLGHAGALDRDESFPRARELAERALELDASCAEAHAILAQFRFEYDWDFDAAARSFHEALRLGPELALTHHAYAHFLSCIGLHEKGLESVRVACALEPLWPMVSTDTAWFHYRARDWERAEAESRRALDLEPSLVSAALCLVASLEKQGEHGRAWSALRAFLVEHETYEGLDTLDELSPQAALDAFRVRRRERLERIAEAEPVSPRAHVFSLAGLDRRAEMLEHLERAFEVRDRVVLLIQVHPAFDAVRDHPRFTEIVERVGFPREPERWLDDLP